MLLVLAFLYASLVSAADKPMDTEEAIRRLTDLGAQIRRADQLPDQPVIGVILNKSTVKDSDLEPLAAFPLLHFADLAQCEIHGEGLKYLKNARHLQALNLNDTPLQDTGLQYLKDHNELHTLFAANTRITSKGLAELKKHQNHQAAYAA
jgi:hypothetical protein